MGTAEGLKIESDTHHGAYQKVEGIFWRFSVKIFIITEETLGKILKLMSQPTHQSIKMNNKLILYVCWFSSWDPWLQ